MPRQRIVFADIESIGVDPDGPIRQIAAVAVDETLREVEAFDAKLPVNWRETQGWRKRPQRAPLPVEIETARRFAEFLSRHATLNIMTARGATLRVAQLAAHHAVHDGAFPQAFFARNKRFYPGDYRMLCTVQRAQWFFHESDEAPPPADFKLATLCEYFRVPFPREKQHDALCDVRATVELYRAILAHEADIVCRGRRREPVRPDVPNLAHTVAPERFDQNALPFNGCQRIVPRRPSGAVRFDK